MDFYQGSLRQFAEELLANGKGNAQMVEVAHFFHSFLSRPNKAPIHCLLSREMFSPLDEFWAFGLASVGVGATAEAQFVHLVHHLFDTVGSFNLA